MTMVRACPFCGGSDLHGMTEPSATQDCPGRYWIECTTCRTRGPMVQAFDASEGSDVAVHRWNDRRLQPDLPPRVTMPCRTMPQ